MVIKLGETRQERREGAALVQTFVKDEVFQGLFVLFEMVNCECIIFRN